MTAIARSSDFALTPPPEPKGPRPRIIGSDALFENGMRFCLTRTLGPGKAVAFCGCNPSVAGHVKNDPTILREAVFTRSWGYGRFYKVNVYPFPAAKMKDLHAWLRGDREAVERAWKRNIELVSYMLIGADFFVACWGNLVEPEVAARFIADLDARMARPIQWHCIGTTNSGAPTHPMARGRHRVPDDVKPVRWPVVAED
jgi:hypothetical protein